MVRVFSKDFVVQSKLYFLTYFHKSLEKLFFLRSCDLHVDVKERPGCLKPCGLHNIASLAAHATLSDRVFY